MIRLVDISKWRHTPEVLPKELQSIDVVEQVAKEYEWTLKILSERGLANQ